MTRLCHQGRWPAMCPHCDKPLIRKTFVVTGGAEHTSCRRRAR